VSSQASTPTLSVPDGVLAEAAVWIARLHGPERSAAVETGWRDWFGAHPDHAAAWEVVSDKWTKSHAIPVGLVHPPVRLPRRHSRRRVQIALAATCGAVSLLIGSAVMLWGRGVVTTTIGEQKTLNLGDGTRVELNTDTRLIVKYDATTRVVELKSGEAYFSVAHELRPFVVMAGNRKVIAVGTSFTVRRDQSADAMTVTLIEGRVAVAPTSAPDVLPKQETPEVMILSAGERLRIPRHAPSTVDTPSMDRATGWMRGQLIFDHTPLSEAVQELNRYSTTRLRLTSPETGKIPVSGTFRVSAALSFAHATAETYNLELVRRDDEIILRPMSHGAQPRE
jgi:transmembrane sensor